MASRIKKLSRIGKVGKLHTRNKINIRVPSIPPLDNQERYLVSGRIREILLALGGSSGDLPLAKRIHALQQTYPRGTIPELIVFDWLKQKGFAFDYQAQFGGGRATLGGSVPDFVVIGGPTAMVWRVQGDYFHPDKSKNLIEAIRFLGKNYGRSRITTVVDMFESDLINRRPEIFEKAMSGIAIGKGQDYHA